MTVMLGCDVDANPPINATGWLKNEKDLPNSSPDHQSLVLQDVSVQDVGWYQCTTKYHSESISSIGYFLNIHHIVGPTSGVSEHFDDAEDSELLIEETFPSLENSDNSHKDRSMSVTESVTSSQKLSGRSFQFLFDFVSFFFYVRGIY